MDEKTNYNLYIPSNIDINKQYWEGISRNELLFIVVVTFVALAITLFLKIPLELDNTIIGGAILIVASCSYLIAKKDKSNVSLLVLILNFLKFLKSQKKYKYKYRWSYLYEEEKKEYYL